MTFVQSSYTFSATTLLTGMLGSGMVGCDARLQVWMLKLWIGDGGSNVVQLVKNNSKMFGISTGPRIQEDLFSLKETIVAARRF